MWTEGLLHYHQNISPTIPSSPFLHYNSHPILKLQTIKPPRSRTGTSRTPTSTFRKRLWTAISASALSQPHPLDLTEDNIRLVLADARVELSQLFDDSVGITGQVELAELDGPFVKISLKGRFWHRRSTVVARLGNYLKQRIPEILEVDIEDEKQLDDSPANF